MKKKILGAISVILLVIMLFVLTGCSNDTSNKEKVNNVAIEQNEEIKVEKTREYKVCDLVGHKREIVDRRTRSQKINDLIREKYSQDAVEAIFANYLKYLQGGEKKEEKWLTEYEEFQNYREVCKQKVDAEGGGENG